MKRGLPRLRDDKLRRLLTDANPWWIGQSGWTSFLTQGDPPDPATPDSVTPNASDPPGPPESEQPQTPRLRRCCLGLSSLCLDRLGLTQAIGGLVLGLIALFTSYDHITAFGYTIHLQQQWGVVFILASVATVFVDAQLATRSRLRAANESLEERDRAAEARERQARETQRQGRCLERQEESLSLLRRSTLLCGRVQLDPTPTNRARFQFFLTLLAQSTMEGPEP
ncbi:MAG: hypothetical protein VKM17_01190 [Cyanobacteriota bacterium]|nr:hypothetical protein [Cyanobacteriota bacterium]